MRRHRRSEALAPPEGAPDTSPAQVLRTLRGPRRRRWLRWLPWILGILVLAGALPAWRAFRAPPPRVYVGVAVSRGDVVTTAIATGNLQPKASVSVGAELSGRVAEVLVETNDRVRRGQVLARFDEENLRAAFAQASASVEVARANLRRAEVGRAEAAAARARVRSLHGADIVSEEALEAAEAAFDRSEAELGAARADLVRARASLQSARTNLGKAVLVSPIDGVVLQRNVEPGNAVAASLSAPVLFVVAEDLAAMELHVAVDEADVGAVEVGQRARFSVDAFPDRVFEATVEKIELAPTVADNVVTYRAILDLRNEDGALLPGMTATATLRTGVAEDVLRVPDAALRWSPPVERARQGPSLLRPPHQDEQPEAHRSAVHVLRAGQPVAVAVRAGRSDGRFTAVLGGELAEGDEVVVGSHRDGERGTGP